MMGMLDGVEKAVLQNALSANRTPSAPVDRVHLQKLGVLWLYGDRGGVGGENNVFQRKRWFRSLVVRDHSLVRGADHFLDLTLGVRERNQDGADLEGGDQSVASLYVLTLILVERSEYGSLAHGDVWFRNCFWVFGEQDFEGDFSLLVPTLGAVPRVVLIDQRHTTTPVMQSCSM